MSAGNQDLTVFWAVRSCVLVYGPYRYVFSPESLNYKSFRRAIFVHLEIIPDTLTSVFNKKATRSRVAFLLLLKIYCILLVVITVVVSFRTVDDVTNDLTAVA